MGRVILSKNDLRLGRPIDRRKDLVESADLTGSRELLEHEGTRQKQFEELLRTGERKSDDYSSRLVKYIPSEVIALYVTLGTIIDSANSQSKIALSGFVLLLGLVATPLYLWRVQKVNKVRQLAISTGAYVVSLSSHREAKGLSGCWIEAGLRVMTCEIGLRIYWCT